MKQKNDFETSLKKLEAIVNDLEEGSLPLDKSLNLFTEGIKLSRQCTTQLKEAKSTVEMLIKKDGIMKVEPFDINS